MHFSQLIKFAFQAVTQGAFWPKFLEQVFCVFKSL